MPDTDLPTLLFVPGELHIFRATASYHALELSAAFDLILLVGEQYRGDPFFQKFLKACPVREVCFFPVKGKIWRRHRSMVSLIGDLIRSWRPAVVYQHSFVYPHNLYVRFFARRTVPGARNIVFQAAMTAPDLDVLAANLAAGEAMRFAERYRIPLTFAKHAYRLHYHCWELLSYRLLPLLLTGHILPLPYDLLACRLRPGFSNWPDGYLVYNRADRENIFREYGPQNYRIVRNPVSQVGAVLDREIYSVTHRAQRIVVLPSQDWVNEEISAQPQNRDKIIERYIGVWTAALVRLRERFSGYQLLWKPHPVHSEDAVMQAIIGGVQQSIPDLQLSEGKQSAEALMLESEIVVSDVSTVLWWASLRPGLVAISLDLWGGAGGDAMKGNFGIHYVSSIEQIDQVAKSRIADSIASEGRSVSETVNALLAPV